MFYTVIIEYLYPGAFCSDVKVFFIVNKTVQKLYCNHLLWMSPCNDKKINLVKFHGFLLILMKWNSTQD